MVRFGLYNTQKLSEVRWCSKRKTEKIPFGHSRIIRFGIEETDWFINPNTVNVLRCASGWMFFVMKF